MFTLNTVQGIVWFIYNRSLEKQDVSDLLLGLYKSIEKHKEREDMSKINMTNKYQTRDGKPVRILCVDRKSRYPVIALVGEDEELITYTEKGLFSLTGVEVPGDLIPAPQEYWVNIYDDGESSLFFSTREQADERAGPDRISCVKVTKGEGL